MQTIRTADLGENMVIMIMTEEEAEDLLKMRRNREYLAKLDQSITEAENGNVVMYTKEQMRAMEGE